MKRRLFDRPDGYLLRKVDHFFRLMPHVMPNRNDAQVFFEEQISLEGCNKLMRELRSKGYRVAFLHIFIACFVRVLSQKPKINRFVAGRKTYARNHIAISFAVKKQMTEDAEETILKLYFDPASTLYDTIEKLNSEIALAKEDTGVNMEAEKLARLFKLVPNFLLGLLVDIIKILDYFGLIPNALLKGSPFHTSLFITDLGSLGINPVYHHIYNFGTTTLFIAFGTKGQKLVLTPDNAVKKHKIIDIRVAADERVVDGLYYAKSVKLSKYLLEHPELLLTPPDEVLEDDQISHR